MKIGKKQFIILLTLGMVWLMPITGRAAILTYSFDDGHISNYAAAFPILNSYGQAGTVNIVSNSAASGYLNRINPTQLLEMQDAGWEICSHSKTHPSFRKIPQTYEDEPLTGWLPVNTYNYTYKTNYTYTQLPFVLEDEDFLVKKQSINQVEATPGSYFLDNDNDLVYVHTTNSSNPSAHEIRADSVQRELEMSKNELTEMGLNVQNFIVPYSDWSENRRDLAMEYYNSVGAGYHNGYFNNIPLDDPYWLARRPIINEICEDGTSVDVVKSWVDQAIAEDTWLILMFHCIGDEESRLYWPEENLAALAEWVNTQDILVVTQQQGLDLAAVPIPQTWILILSGLGITAAIRKKKSSGRQRI